MSFEGMADDGTEVRVTLLSGSQVLPLEKN